MSVVYNIENPKGTVFAKYGNIKVEGWAFSSEGKQVNVLVMFDKKKVKIPVDKERPDVRDAYPPEYSDYTLSSGFSYFFELTEKEKKKNHVVRIYIYEDTEEIFAGEYSVLSSEEQIGTTWERIRKTNRFIVDHIKQGKIPTTKDQWELGIQKVSNILRHGHSATSQHAESIDTLLDPYDVWVEKDRWNNTKDQIARTEMQGFNKKPLISVIIPVYKTNIDWLKETISSVLAQVYDQWEVIIVDDHSQNEELTKCIRSFEENDERIHAFEMEKNSHISRTSNYAVSKCSGEYLAFLDHDDLLSVNALFEVAKAINSNEAAEVLYSDDDKIDVHGHRYDPQFKPEYSPELLLSYMYFSHLFVVKTSLFKEVGGFRDICNGSQDYDLALRVSELTQNIVHIPRILYHWRATDQSTATDSANKPYSIDAGLRAVSDAVIRRNIPAAVSQPEFARRGHLGIYELKYNQKQKPLVSIVIPTKDRKDLLARCIASIQKRTKYEHYEIIIVDDGSTEADTLEYLRRLPYTVIRNEKLGSFNFSRLVNLGVKHSKGDYVILLNNDTEVIEPSWIDYMLLYMLMPGVGAVGAKLLYSNRHIQHAGVVLRLGNGIAGHAFKLIAEMDGGYLSYAKVARNYSAVTGACLMTSKAVYTQMGGLDEKEFAVSYNDVDYCQRLIQSGLRIVYSPSALLYHHEGMSRGVEQSGHYSNPQEEYNFFKKWIKNREYQDPYYNQNLSYENEWFQLDLHTIQPMSKKPLKILLITHNLNFEGAPMVQFHVARKLQDYGYEFTVFSSVDGLLRKEYEKLGIPVICDDINALRLTNTFERFLEILQTKAKQYEFNKYDLIYANTTESFWGVKLSELCHMPVVWSIHESIDYRTHFFELQEEYRKEFIHSFMKATRVLYVSKATANLYKELNTYNVNVIRNGIDTSKIDAYKDKYSYEAVRDELNISKETKVITIVGTVCERKGQLLFAKTAQKLIKKYMYDGVLFMIVGASPSPYLQTVEHYIDENNMRSKFRIIDYAANDEIFKYYRATDLLVCASYEESSPLVILEAMAFGVPIVSTNVFGVPEIVRDHQDALLVPPDNEELMAEAIDKVLKDNILSNRIKLSARYRLDTFFTQDQMIAEYDLMFRSVYEEQQNRLFDKFLPSAANL